MFPPLESFFCLKIDPLEASQVTLVIENQPAKAGDVKDVVSIPGSGRSPGGGHSNPVFLLDNPMDRGVWQAAVHRVAQSWARGPYKASLRTKLAEVMELQWSCFQS